MGSKKGKGGTTYGLYARNFPKPARWKVDQDYISRLSDDERRWLAQFHDEYYGGFFSPKREALHSTKELRRECYAANNATNADSYSIHEVSGRLFSSEELPLFEPESLGGQDGSPLPSYLNDQEYKSLREQFRTHLPKDRKARVNETPEMKKARTRLLGRVRAGLLEGEDT